MIRTANLYPTGRLLSSIILLGEAIASSNPRTLPLPPLLPTLLPLEGPTLLLSESGLSASSFAAATIASAFHSLLSPLKEDDLCITFFLLWRSSPALRSSSKHSRRRSSTVQPYLSAYALCTSTHRLAMQGVRRGNKWIQHGEHRGFP